LSDTPPVVLGEAKIIAFLATSPWRSCSTPEARCCGSRKYERSRHSHSRRSDGGYRTSRPRSTPSWRRGVRLARYDSLPQDERGIWTTGNGDRICWFQDPDGNTLSLTQFTGSG